MASVRLEIDVPAEADYFMLPKGVDDRLQHLLNLNNDGKLTPAERREAEGLVELVEKLSMLKIAQRIAMDRERR